jgi:maltose alpha-D-glucosyltransferase/alpha-amylase
MLQGADDVGSELTDADWDAAFARLDALAGTEAVRQTIRVHGDYHLGQTLVAGGELYLLDFEGEPARPAEERRQRDYALRDVAGMLRSFAYAVYAPLADFDDESGDLAQWAAALLRACEASFLDAYLRTAEDADFLLPRGVRRPFLWAYLLDKALYEVRYELGSRPDWAWIPLRGLVDLLREPAEAGEPAPA